MLFRSGIEKDSEEEIDTIGGLVFHIAQRIPNRGEIIDGYNGVRFHILDVDARRIKKIMIVIPDDETDIEISNADK